MDFRIEGFPGRFPEIFYSFGVGRGIESRANGEYHR